MVAKMGKRSDFERIERDFYPTPKEAVTPLLPHLDILKSYIEPCAGDGALVQHLPLDCIFASDIRPMNDRIHEKDALNYCAVTIVNADYFITNPPWDRKVLHPLIEHLSNLLPTWLLFDADWMHTRQSSELIKRCRKIVSVGRIKWIPKSTMTGKDNCCWYLFDRVSSKHPIFYGRNRNAK